MEQPLVQQQRLQLAVVVVMSMAALLWTAPLKPRNTPTVGYGQATATKVAATTALGQLLDRRFTLPARERKVRVANALTVDLDADGDIDAIATTSTGKVLVWINIGDNRLERRTPVKTAPGQPRAGRPTGPGTHTLRIDVVDNRWVILPPHRGLDAPPALSLPLPRSADRMAATPHLSLPARAPPAAPRFTL